MKERQLDFHDERPRDMEAYLAHIQARRHPIGLLLDHIDDAQNLGALFRLADAARLAHIWTYGPAMRVEDSRKFRRISRGGYLYVPSSGIALEDIPRLKKDWQLTALEPTNRSIPYTEFQPSGPCILVAGNEKDGVSEELLALCEHSIHIPMYGANTSMNVAMAAAIAVYNLLEKAGKV